MDIRQIFSFPKRNKLLAILLIAFLVKQLLMIAVFPIFQGPDETIHYSRIQKLANSQPNTSVSAPKNDYTYSEEIDKTMEKVGADKIARHSSVTQDFSEGQIGPNESEIKNSQWSRSAKTPSLKNKILDYYSINAVIEKMFSGSDIIQRFFSVRIFSAILGTMSLLFIFLAFVKTGLNDKMSFFLSTLIAFQPMFSQASAIVNYDILLIFSFVLFTYGAVWSLKNGPNWKNILAMIVAITLGILTKAPSIALVPVFLGLLIYFLVRKMKRRALTIFIIAGSLILALTIFIFANMGH